MLLFALEPQSPFAVALAGALDTPLSPHEERVFVDGEFKVRPLVDPRGADAYVVHSLYGAPGQSPHDKLMRLLMLIATLRDHGAARVSAVVPYFAYARKDRQTKPFDPVSLRYVAQMFEAVGTAQVIALEPHNVAAFQNAFRCPTVHLEAHRLFDAVVDDVAAGGALAVASPDPGGVKRAQLWHEALEERLSRPVGFAMVDKRRSGGLLGGGELVAGAVKGATVLLLDDLIASGETLRRAAAVLHREGAKAVHAFAAHGLFIEPADRTLSEDVLGRIVVCDSVPPFRVPPLSPLHRKLRVVSSVPLFTQAIRDSHASWRR
jgi:ribose-phosphate pyrophosphokinase